MVVAATPAATASEFTFTFKANQKMDPGIYLRACGATEEEIAFLVQRGSTERGHWAGERVELNAMTSPQFVEFVHSQLETHGVKKVVPDQKTLVAAYQHTLKRDALMAKVKTVLAEQQAETASEVFTAPFDLEEMVRERIEGTTDNWITAVQEMAREEPED